MTKIEQLLLSIPEALQDSLWVLEAVEILNKMQSASPITDDPEAHLVIETAIQMAHEVYDISEESLEDSTVTVAADEFLSLVELLLDLVEMHEGYDVEGSLGYLDLVKSYPKSQFANRTKH